MSVPELFDTIIIGSGGGGFSCALELHETKVRYLLLERAPKLGAGLNQIKGDLPNFFGGFFHSGEELRSRIVEIADQLDLNYLLDHQVESASLASHSVIANGTEFRAKTLVLATGYKKRKLLPDQEKLIQQGIHYDKDGGADQFAGTAVAIVGGGDNAFLDAIELSAHCPRVFLIHRSRRFKARPDLISAAERCANIEFVLDSRVKTLVGSTMLEAVVVVDRIDGRELILNVPHLIVRAGYEPNTELFSGQVRMDVTGHIVIDADCSTSQPGVFAVGDITTPGYPRLATAVGHGMIAAGAVRKFLNQRSDEITRFIQQNTLDSLERETHE